MGNGVGRTALWALLVLVLAATLASIPTALAGPSPSYTLQGYVEQPSAGPGLPGAPVPAGVTVRLISGATHTVYTTKTSSASGGFSFTSSSTSNVLGPGWWGIQVLPQANLSLSGCKPCGILPANPNPAYYQETAANLTSSAGTITVGNVSIVQYNATIFGNVTQGGNRVSGANVQLLDPVYNGFVFANNTTNATGAFKFAAPHGSWVLETTVPGAPSAFNLSKVNIVGTTLQFNPVVRSYLAWGFMNQKAFPGAHVPNGGNVTLFDRTNGYIYSSPTPPGGFYAIGTYPGNFVSGSQSFDVILSAVGYGTSSYPLTVSPASPASTRTVLLPAQAPPAQYLTVLNFSTGFNNVTVNTTASLGNDSVFPELVNASVGQLWAQLALDWQHNLSFGAGNLGGVTGWIRSQGPFFPAVQAGLMANSTAFTTKINATFASSSTCSAWCGLGSSATLSYAWNQRFNTTSNVAANGRGYTIAFSFRHPTHGQGFNYTVVLPTGYVLQADNPVPAQSQIVPAGTGGTYTKFTLVANASDNPSGSATFTVVKFANLTANVNVSASNFAFSKRNIVNATHAGYKVIVGSGENVTFSGANSTFSTGTNGTTYAWVFGDSGTNTSSKPVTYHTYSSPGSYAGRLTVTASSGIANSTSFTVVVGNTPPTLVLQSNATAAETFTGSSGGTYYLVNWSTALSFNASASTSTVFGGVNGTLSVLLWNLTAKSSKTANYSAGTGANPLTPFNITLLGNGHYYNATTVFGSSVIFHGWQYNLTLTAWDYAGHKATASAYVLVRDTQKPVPVIQLLNSKGKPVSGSGLVEAANHTAFVSVAATNSSDPNNGTIVSYNWSIGVSGNGSANRTVSRTSAGAFSLWLDPQSKPYTFNLTVKDLANNTAYVVSSLTVAVNVSQRPVLSVTNLTTPTSLTEGSSYTVWVNITNTVGRNSTAQNLTVRFYLTNPSGSGSQIYIGGSPSSVQFYNYTTNTTIASTPFATGVASLPYNKTVRAVVSFNPGRTGTFWLWANATASNEFAGDYVSGANAAHTTVSLSANPLTQYLEYAGIAAVVVGVIIVAILIYRRRSARPSGGKPSGGKSGLERGKDEDEED